MNGIQDFLASQRPNAWLRYENLDVFVRRAHHIIDRRGDELVETFDIANLSIEQPTDRGRGTFKRFLVDVKAALEESDLKVIYVENVLSPEFQIGVERMGFKLIEWSNPRCYYMKL